MAEVRDNARGGVVVIVGVLATVPHQSDRAATANATWPATDPEDPR